MLVWAHPNPLGLDNSPVDAGSISGDNHISSIYNGLIRRSIAADRAHVPDLAATMPIVTSDSRNWTLTLKPGLKFSDGSDLNASSVVFSYHVQLTASISSGAGFLSQYFTFDSIVALDTLTVKFNMLIPYAFAPNLFSYFIFSEDHFGPMYDACLSGVTTACNWNNDITGGNLVGGSGPFMLDTFNIPNNVVELVPNPNYYLAAQIKIDRIIFITIAESTAAKAAFASGGINIFDRQYRAKAADFVSFPEITDVFVGAPSIQEMLSNHLHPYFGLGSYTTTGANTRTDFSLNANRTAASNIRKAMSHMIDRNFIANEISGGLSSPAATIMPTISIGWDSTITPRTYDINVAKAFMEAAGFDYTGKTFDTVTGAMDNPFFSISLMSPNGDVDREQWAARMVIELPKIGIGVLQHLTGTMLSLYPRTFTYPGPPPVFSEGGYDVFFLAWSFDLDFNPTGLYEKRFQNPSCCNVYNYDNSTVEDAIADYVAELDAPLRLAKVKLVQELLYDDQPTIPIVSNIDHWAWSSNIIGLDGLSMSQRDFQWELVDFDTGTTTVTSTLTDTIIDTSTLTDTTTSTTITSETSVTTSTDLITSTISSVSTTVSPITTKSDTETATLPINLFGIFYGTIFIITFYIRKEKKTET